METMTKTITEPETTDIEPPAPDKYDAAVEYLTAHPDEIFHAWQKPGHPHHNLFAPVTPSGMYECRTDDKTCGCLTMIRFCNSYVAHTDRLTRFIRDDNRIPQGGSEVTVDHLPIFAGWQRRIDKELGRE
jgi:hypothetical protein